MIDVHGLLGSPGLCGDLGSWGVEGYAPFCEYLARVSGGDESVPAPKGGVDRTLPPETARSLEPLCAA
jgi:hypothetical protein